MNKDLDRIYHARVNMRLKYIAVGILGIGIALLLVATLCFDHISWTTMLVMRGCAGVSAIIFVILTGILVYRVNNEYHQCKYRNRKE